MRPSDFNGFDIGDLDLPEQLVQWFEKYKTEAEFERIIREEIEALPTVPHPKGAE